MLPVLTPNGALMMLRLSSLGVKAASFIMHNIAGAQLDVFGEMTVGQRLAS